MFIIAIMAALVGGVVAEALTFRGKFHRLAAFLVPVIIATALMQLPLLGEALRAAARQWSWDMLASWIRFHLFTMLMAALITGVGWFISYCIRNVFED